MEGNICQGKKCKVKTFTGLAYYGNACKVKGC
jgi:hypothetical protein